MKAVILSVLIAAGSAGIVQAKPHGAFDKAAAQAGEDTFAARANAGDAGGIAKLYTSDAIVMPPGAPRAEGRPGIERYWAEVVKGVTDVKLTTVDVRTMGPDAAQETGVFAMKTRTTPPQTLSGKFVIIWRRSGGDWKLATDIWNADK